MSPLAMLISKCDVSSMVPAKAVKIKSIVCLLLSVALLLVMVSYFDVTSNSRTFLPFAIPLGCTFGFEHLAVNVVYFGFFAIVGTMQSTVQDPILSPLVFVANFFILASPVLCCVVLLSLVCNHHTPINGIGKRNVWYIWHYLG